MFDMSCIRGWFVCSRCGSLFESSLFPTIALTCPFCGKKLDGSEERDIIDVIIDWGKEEFMKLPSNVTEGTLTAELRFTTIQVNLNYIVKGTKCKKTQMIGNSNDVHSLIGSLSLSRNIMYKDSLIIISQLYRKNNTVQVMFKNTIRGKIKTSREI